jgi:hypothetical protein
MDERIMAVYMRRETRLLDSGMVPRTCGVDSTDVLELSQDEIRL